MAIYNFYREPIFKYYKEQIDFLLRSRENLENINIKKSLNMNLILSSACFTEGVMVLMLSWAVMISLCHAVMRLPGYLSWNVPFDGAAVRPITKGISSCIHALPAL